MKSNISNRKSVSSKMEKYLVLKECQIISEFLLETLPLSKGNLHLLLDKYQYVFVKPDIGSNGRKIFCISWDYANSFKIIDNEISYGSVEDLFSHVRSKVSSGRFIVQQGIYMKKYQGICVDIRVFMQKPHGKWLVSGAAARVASSPTSVITNYSSGGSVTTLSDYLLTCTSDTQKLGQVEDLIYSICNRGAFVLNTAYPNFAELGFDLVLDKQLKPWIIEVNTLPKFKLFKELDESIYEKIGKNHDFIINNSHHLSLKE